MHPNWNIYYRKEPMTPAQKELLKKYLNDKNIQNLNQKSFECICSLIGLIVNTSNRIPTFERKPSKWEIEVLDQYFNQHPNKIKHRNQYNLVSDEYVTVKIAHFLNPQNCWFLLEQSWFKGMSNSPTHHYQLVQIKDQEVQPFEGIYNILYELAIYSEVALRNYYYQIAKIHIEQNPSV